ncbi:homeobox protein PKNOX1-like [Ylistrum balloti]|uniref:homeobox protein PKNOX1-like n=1 Tax=Ylistrum balloti TaxID=509963 RepID=UPI0029058AA6|nr:homeobox protein PKNOX1-like [Ylistrum balloti]
MSVVQPGLVPSFTDVQVLGTIVSSAPSDSNNPAVITKEGDVNSEGEKRAIYGHPLFPLMALLFEKCEQASQTSDCPSSDSFDVDIQAFVHHQEKDRKPFFSEDPELDALMVKAIQVLRIHLLELEKVTELCKDFCNRYIACLKGKLQSEQLLRIDSDFDDPPPEELSPPGQASVPMQQVMSSGVVNSANNLTMIQPGMAQPAMATLNQGQIVSGGTVYQMVQTPQGLVAQPIQIHTAPVQPQITATPVIHGSTPLSQIGMVSSPVTQAQTVSSQQSSMQSALLSDSDGDDILGKKKNKRGVLPKSATQIMKSWLFQHIVHPYPTEDEKRQIAAQTNLTLLQVNNWFINARRRILQPMLDASNPEQGKAKKPKTQHRPVQQRFWPDSIANIQPQFPGGASQAKGEITSENQLVFNESLSSEGMVLNSDTNLHSNSQSAHNEQDSQSSLKIDSDADDENSDDNREEDDKLLESDSSSLG